MKFDAKRALCAAVVSLIFVIILSGCGPAITSGEVYDKEFIPAHSEVQYMSTVIFDGKTMRTALIPYAFHYGDRYVIYIKAFDGENWQTEDFFVPAEVYNALQIGDVFVYDESRGDMDDEPYTKEKGG